jgi:hypothetical protein
MNLTTLSRYSFGMYGAAMADRQRPLVVDAAADEVICQVSGESTVVDR